MARAEAFDPSVRHSRVASSAGDRIVVGGAARGFTKGAFDGARAAAAGGLVGRSPHGGRRRCGRLAAWRVAYTAAGDRCGGLPDVLGGLHRGEWPWRR